AHVEGWQWRPDLIWFDNLRSMRTASWHVQQLYSQYKGQNVLTLKMDGANVTGADGQDGLFASAVADGDKVYVKVINTSEQPQSVELAFGETAVKAVERVDFTSDLLYEDNTLDEPERIAPVKAAFTGKGKSLTAPVPAQCFSVFVVER
ncbi:MAG: alpha-L-arabinofuranosidase, partial [Bacteroidales bacterium]|nr:alpha-L-arabinofuranosidase [Bacteroidales bacterium]